VSVIIKCSPTDYNYKVDNVQNQSICICKQTW